MRRIPFLPAVVGLGIGALLFFAAFFVLRIVLFILLIGAVSRFIGRRRMYHHRMHRMGGYSPYGRPGAIPLRGRADIPID